MLDLDLESDDGEFEYDVEMGWDYSIKLHLTPSLESAERALDDIKKLLKPPRNSGSGYNRRNFPPVLGERLEWMKTFLWTFCDSTRNAEARGNQSPQWIAASLATAGTAMKGKWFTRNLHFWSKAYILDREDLPLDLFGDWKISKIDDEDLAAELHLHLQGIGKYIKAGDLVQYLSDQDVQHRFKLKNTISLATAK
ncbi:hypothetical protein PAXRUDRAFT_16061 [Paxillus rubicundulus Ve08.2h10]|uniref:Unplaced genomic scaffold scaffold_1322, whole genome shotgun sequence n=1 Tax=Paxillus rubicundulus Ve08.2h10 TaxID=930991 RepID=A0A0D0CWP5_9AGAM|nr:hypothetical protein PAXRUDRAFT_16061 [Paxillus rubicundulus Ve08.2h10]